jgi:GABA(A) receptor-associated protein
MISFKERLSLKERKRQSEIVLTKHPDRIPIIVERDPKSDSKIPLIDRCKYLVPKDFSVAQLLYVVRKRIQIKPEQALFFFAGGQLVTTSSLLSELHDKNRDPDGFLYITYVGESAFG